VRLIGLLVLTLFLHTAVFAQKLPDPEARNKSAVSVASTRSATSVQTHRSRSAATSVQQMKATHKTTASSKPKAPAVSGPQPQTKSKPMKFSYNPPNASGKTTSVKNPPSPRRSREETHSSTAPFTISTRRGGVAFY
jgi:cytoskeletal protein RodZ